MKKSYLLVLILACSQVGRAQILHPVRWSYGSKKTGQHEVVVFIKATIGDGWHIYSTTQKDGGPVKTSFAFNTSKDYYLDGSISEPAPVTHYEKSFEMDVLYFENSVIFRQTVKLDKDKTIIKGTLRFMVCNNKQCLPPENVIFSIPVK
ncbi:MAG: protein-disulfide reductase DsbD domain-containing protein [Sphingobacteriales bacterium]